MLVTPHHSIGDLVLGMHEEDVTAILGQPQERDEEIDPDDNVSIHYTYPQQNLQLTFWGDCDFKLGSITCADPAATLDGKAIVGISESDLTSQHPSFALEDSIDDDDSDDEAGWQNYEDLERELNAWLAEGKVQNISIGPAWQDDEETPIWPTT